MKCEKVKNLLGWYYDGELSASDHAAVVEHLSHCFTCSAAFAALVELDRTSRLLSVPEPPADLWDRLLDKLPTSGSPPVRATRRLLWRPRFVAAAAAILLCMVGGLLAHRMTTRDGPAVPGPIDTEDQNSAAGKNRETAIAVNLAKLDPEDRRLALSQKLCAAGGCDSELGAGGPPFRVVVGEKHLFCCCQECERWALAHPKEALAKARQLVQANRGPGETP
jgi:Putative zinc-finger